MKRKNDKPSLWRDMAEIIAVVAVFGLLLWLFLAAVRTIAGYVREGKEDGRMMTDTPDEESGVGRTTASVGLITRYTAESPADEEESSLWVYVEGEGTPPAWWNPDEPMAAEWYADNPDDMGEIWAEYGGDMEPHPPVYWNPDELIYGWDGHSMERWEMEMFARIAYLECRGCSRECQEAVVDAILRLWESEYYSTTLYGTLSAVNEDGTYAYSPYPTMWDEEYDPDILAKMRELCEERFYNAPEYTAPFFRTKHYHVDWSVPCYCFPEDNVYFSTFKEGD